MLSTAKVHAAPRHLVHAAALKVSAVVTPGSISAAATSATSVQVNWTAVAGASGYNVLKSTGGKKFFLLATVGSDATTRFSDTTVLSNHAYAYEVQAVSGAKVTAASKAVSVTTPLAAPSNLAGSYHGESIRLTWTDNEPAATGYLVFRSSDGKSYSPLAKLSGGAVSTFSDTTVTVGKTYSYEIEATTAGKASAPSAAAVVAPPSTTGGVSITTLFGNELVITATGDYDNIALSQDGSTLTVTADGATFTNTVPTAGVFVYTRGGTDSVSIDSSVTVRTTVDSIDSAYTAVTSAGANVSVWADSTDAFAGSGVLHSVVAFAGNVSKAAGASLTNPSDSGATTSPNLSLFGAGPVADDVNQGEIGDCYFLSTLAAFAQTNPVKLQESAVDLGDGTYAVQFYNSQSKPVFVRVSDSFAVGGFDGYAFAQPGSNGAIWAMVMEKAFAYFRTGANTYASLSAGWMGEAYSALGVASTFLSPSGFSESSFYATVWGDLANKKPVTLAAANAPDMVNNHAYTLISTSKDTNGATHYVVRNPWGASGDALEDSHGYATLTFSQLVANFSEGCAGV